MFCDCDASAGPSILTPARSIAISTGISGCSSCWYSISSVLLHQQRAQRCRELQREVRALARIVHRRLDGNLRERQRLGAAAADVLVGRAPCSRCARAPDPRGDARTAWRRAGSSRASCRSRGREAPRRAVRAPGRRTSDRARLFRRSRLRARAGECRATRARVESSVEARGRQPANGTYCACRGRVENDSPTIDPRIAEPPSGSTRTPTRPAARRSSASAAHAFERVDHGVFLADGLRRRRELHDERSESQPREQLEAPLLRSAAIPHRFGLEVHRHVDPDARQLAALPRVLRVAEQPFAIALVRDLRRVRQQRFERAVGRDQIARPFLADARARP